MTWDGTERRKMSQEDHDLLIRIETKLNTFCVEIKSLKSRVGWHDKFIYIGIGGIMVIEFVFKLIK